MRYSISTCSFYKMQLRKLLNMPEDFGVEIFSEYGSDAMWDTFLQRLSQRGFNGFSIHAPFAFLDFAADCDEKRMFDTLKHFFDLYHRYNGEFYVLHPYGEVLHPEDFRYMEDSRARVLDRMARFHEICRTEGIRLAVENVCDGKIPMFNQEQFLHLFHEIPDLHCVIDVGHALVTGMNVGEMQRELGSRICGYHLHNNDGTFDSHDRLRDGIMDWKAFAENCGKYTPDAVGVLEYLKYQDLAIYEDDRAYLEGLFQTCKG